MAALTETQVALDLPTEEAPEMLVLPVTSVIMDQLELALQQEILEMQVPLAT